METFYLLIVLILIGLAATDLVVGVSNDAVNFLNSAIGSKVATYKTIMLVASAGIFIGATFSSGMMEIARKGIFNPQYFSFAEIMILFAAVMITDILLLDLFSTLGLPTSTTVSIVFELLGASVLLALLKVNTNGEPISEVASYINTAKAVQIIVGILLSVVIAFLVGLVVQYLSRTLLTFHYEKTLKSWGSLWGGLAMSLLTYFLLIKGIKGASFVSGSAIQWISDHALMLIGTSLLAWAGIFQLLTAFGVNILKVIVMFGTFSLAMAFAGNDLVNFIGVPIAGLESYLIWKDSGVPANEFMMDMLSSPVRTNTWWLLMAGFIMVITLWFSKKARTVVETQVDLGRQSAGDERFEPTTLARWLVRGGRVLGSNIEGLLSRTTRHKINVSFRPVVLPEDTGVAFDLVRASVNLTVAAMLISFATSLKLPLSTTYVSFMVAMGASLADRAWDRESAVYRVAGVINVVAGWFVTAGVAFTVSALFAYVMYKLQLGGLIGLMALVGFVLFRSYSYHRKNTSKKEAASTMMALTDLPEVEVKQRMATQIEQLLQSSQESVEHALDAVFKGDRSSVVASMKNTERLQEDSERMTRDFYRFLREEGQSNRELQKGLIKILDHYQDVVRSVQFILKSTEAHLANSHAPFREGQVAQLMNLWHGWSEIITMVGASLMESDLSTAEQLRQKKKTLFEKIDTYLTEQLDRASTGAVSQRNHQLYILVIQEMKDLIAVTPRFTTSMKQIGVKSVSSESPQQNP